MKTGGGFGGENQCSDCGRPTFSRRCKACYLAASAPETPIRKASRASGQSIASWARQCGLSRTTARRIAAGQPVTQQARKLIRLSEVSGVPLSKILAGE